MSKKTSKNLFKRRFLLLLLCGIDQQLSLRDICKKVHRTKQALNYHLRKMERQNLIFRIQSYPFAIYELTPLGKRVKENLLQREKSKIIPLWRLHSLVLGFNILDYGNYQMVESAGKRKRLFRMNNWYYVEERIGKHFIQVQNTGLLKIYCPDEYGESYEIIYGRAITKAQMIIQELCDKYDMKIDPNFKLIRRPHYAIVNQQKFIKGLFGDKIITSENLWLDYSEGTGELETHTPDLLDQFVKLPQEIKALRQELTPAILELRDQIKLHLEVQKKTKKLLELAIKEFRKKKKVKPRLVQKKTKERLPTPDEILKGY